MLMEEINQMCSELQIVKNKSILLNSQIYEIEDDIFYIRNNKENEQDINKNLRKDELELSM
jgi:hypothetical protein